MSKFSTKFINDLPGWQVDRYNRWLNHWRMENILKEDCIEENYEKMNDFDREIMLLVKNYDFCVEEGDIRIISPVLLSSKNFIPRYVAVIKKWSDGLFLVAPYSFISEPAVTGELDTCRSHFALSNLELWNSVIAPISSIQKSWLCDQMSDLEIDESLSVFNHITTGKNITHELSKRIGPPILLNDDPRIKYQDQEMQTFAPFRKDCFSYLSTTSA